MMLLYLLLFISASITRTQNDCERLISPSFTIKQKQDICRCDSINHDVNGPTVSTNIKTQSWIEIASCSSSVKSDLHLKFNEILKMCCNSTSGISSVTCYKSLETKVRNRYGIDICSQSNAIVKSECVNELLGFIGNDIKIDAMIEFCKSIENRTPLNCAKSIFNTNIINKNEVFKWCTHASSGTESSHILMLNNAANCIYAMKSKQKLSSGLSGIDIVKFCVESNPHSVHLYSESDIALAMEIHFTPASNCFHYANSIAANNGVDHVLTTNQRIELCKHASFAPNLFDSGYGPVNCTQEVISGLQGTERLKVKDIIELCVGATGIGPYLCYRESRGLGSIAERIAICNAAEGGGPAHCTRRASNLLNQLNRNSERVESKRSPSELTPFTAKQILCVNAVSEDPAVCVNAAPHYLSSYEKIQLCAGTPFSKGLDPNVCLQSVQSLSKMFVGAPKKTLGYFLENLLHEEERISRDLLINMCSFGGSQDPLAAAECMKSAPTSSHHDYVIRMCTNISSIEVIEHVQLCNKLLPSHWNTPSSPSPLHSASSAKSVDVFPSTIICENIQSRPQVEAVVKCATTAGTLFRTPNKLSLMEVAMICRHENQQSVVLQCLKNVSNIPTSSPGNYLLTMDTINELCSSATASSIQSFVPLSQCLAMIAAYPSSKLIFDKATAVRLCKGYDEESKRYSDPKVVLNCLEMQSIRLVGHDHLTYCINQRRVLHSVKVSKVLSEGNDIHVTMGRRFQLWFTLRDQYQGLFMEDVDPSTASQHFFTVSINSNNPQGAILWGQRGNTSRNGILHFNNLVISQPGRVEFKISYRIYDPMTQSFNPLVDAEIFRLEVQQDAKVMEASHCLYVFHKEVCPSSIAESDCLSEFPNIRGYVPTAYYLQNIYCADKLKEWFVETYLNPTDGSLSVEYRYGIDSIWTGVGMPRLEMSFEERLGIPQSKDLSTQYSNKEVKKLIRRSYYKKSLQWHPDRWVGLQMYNTAVSGAFELIQEAYEYLSKSFVESIYA